MHHLEVIVKKSQHQILQVPKVTNLEMLKHKALKKLYSAITAIMMYHPLSLICMHMFANV